MPGGFHSLIDLSDRILEPDGAVPEEEAAARDAARTSLRAFTLYTNPDYQVNWHHEVMFEHLDRWVSGEITRLLIFAPPQHGKSEIVSRVLPAYIMGRHPDDPIIECSYGDSLSSRMNIDAQRIVDSDRFRRVFPNTTLAGEGRKKGKYVRTSDQCDVVGHKGGYRTAGVGGPITGNPFRFGIIDDVYKNDMEANSPTTRQHVWDWYTTVFDTRKRTGDARILITMTRWHQLDLAGQLLALERSDPNADKWTVLRFPGILETEAQRGPYDRRKLGEALWPTRHPLKVLLAAKAKMTPSKWSALFQGDPTPASGVIFHPENFRHFSTEVTHGVLWLLLYDEPAGVECVPRRVRADECVWFQAVDAADVKSNDAAYTCVGTFARTPGGELIVWHVWRAKLEFPKRYKAIVALRDGLAPWNESEGRFEPYGFLPWPKPLAYQAIEMKASGLAIMQLGASEGRSFRGLKTGGQSKSERASSASVLYSNLKVFHHRGADWLTDFEAELPPFPSGAYNDQADTLAYAGIAVMTDVTLGAPPRGGGDLVLSGAGGSEVPRDRFGNVSLEGTSMAEAPSYTFGDIVIQFDDDDGDGPARW